MDHGQTRISSLKAIRQGAAKVTAHRLNYRLSLESIPVELAELAEALNNMLARLEESFQRLKIFLPTWHMNCGRQSVI
jgi:two-component system heavy metal sensor histidine kinase CusS